jgi:hypothetical protein
MSSSKKINCKGTLRQVFIRLRPRTPYPPTPLHAVYVLYTYSHREGGGGGDLTREQVIGTIL